MRYQAHQAVGHPVVAVDNGQMEVAVDRGGRRQQPSARTPCRPTAETPRAAVRRAAWCVAPSRELRAQSGFPAGGTFNRPLRSYHR